jgi:hypothetical protein
MEAGAAGPSATGAGARPPVIDPGSEEEVLAAWVVALLRAMREEWGSSHSIGMGTDDHWTAWRLDGTGTVVRAALPNTFAAALAADWREWAIAWLSRLEAEYGGDGWEFSFGREGWDASRDSPYDDDLHAGTPQELRALVAEATGRAAR